MTIVPPPSEKQLELRSSCRSRTWPTWSPAPAAAAGPPATARAGRNGRSAGEARHRPAVDLAARRGARARPHPGAQVHDRVRQLPPAGRAALRPAQRACRRAGAEPAPRRAADWRPAGRRPGPARQPPGRRPSSWRQAGAVGRAPRPRWPARTTARCPGRSAAQIEEALKAGRLPAVVATSSLELGIDMGAVDLVIQVESPPSVASGLQRTGRAGHNVGDVSRGVIFPKYQGDLVQAAVVAQRMRDGRDRGTADAAQPARRARPADRGDDRDGRLGRRRAGADRSAAPRRSAA